VHHSSHINTIPDTMDGDHTTRNSVQEQNTVQDPILTPAGAAEPRLDQPSAIENASSQQPPGSLFSRILQPVWLGEYLYEGDLNTKFSCENAATIIDVATNQVIIAPYKPGGRPTIPEVLTVQGSLWGENDDSDIPVFGVNGVNGSKFTFDPTSSKNDTDCERPELKYDNPEQHQELDFYPLELVEIKEDAS
jgi:hypothetical protein